MVLAPVKTWWKMFKNMLGSKVRTCLMLQVWACSVELLAYGEARQLRPYLDQYWGASGREAQAPGLCWHDLPHSPPLHRLYTTKYNAILNKLYPCFYCSNHFIRILHFFSRMTEIWQIGWGVCFVLLFLLLD